jgi:hypothetical protein
MFNLILAYILLSKWTVLIKELGQLSLTTDWTTGVRSPAEAKGFSSSLCAQKNSEADPASYPVGTVGPSWVKRGRGVSLTTHPHLVPKSRMSRSYRSSTLGACMA